MMRPNNRDLFVKSESVSEKELNALYSLLQSLETLDIFCQAHELVDRNRITSKKNKIWKESRYYTLRPFRFLINKN